MKRYPKGNNAACAEMYDAIAPRLPGCADDDRMTSALTATAAADDGLDARRLERLQQRLDALPEIERTRAQWRGNWRCIRRVRVGRASVLSPKFGDYFGEQSASLARRADAGISGI